MHQGVIIILLIILFWIGAMRFTKKEPKVVGFNYINDTTDLIHFELIQVNNSNVKVKGILKPNATYKVKLKKGTRYAIRVAGIRQEIGVADDGLMDLYASDTQLIGEALTGLAN